MRQAFAVIALRPWMPSFLVRAAYSVSELEDPVEEEPVPFQEQDPGGYSGAPSVYD